VNRPEKKKEPLVGGDDLNDLIEWKVERIAMKKEEGRKAQKFSSDREKW